jgi:hypothetical protein
VNDTHETPQFTGQNRKQLRLQGCLLHGGIVPGQSLSLQINLYNPQRTSIKSIAATFIQHRETAVDRHNEIIFSVNLPDLSEFNELHLQRHFDLLVPSMYLTPTNNFTTTSYGHLHYINVHYELRLEVMPHGILTKFAVSIPVKVGTETISEEQKEQEKYRLILSSNTASSHVFNETEMPPSYEMVTKNQ